MLFALHASVEVGEYLLGFVVQHVKLRMDALLWVGHCGMRMLRLPVIGNTSLPVPLPRRLGIWYLPPPHEEAEANVHNQPLASQVMALLDSVHAPYGWSRDLCVGTLAIVWDSTLGCVGVPSKPVYH